MLCMKAPFKYKTTFSQSSLASLEIESEEGISTASLKPLLPLIPKNVNLERNLDLLGVAFNAAVANKFNNNGDGIETATAVAIKDYFIHKPANLEHNRENIVGHIVNAGLSEYNSESGNLLDEKEVAGTNEAFNIALAAVVYKIANPSFAQLVEDSGDEDSDNYQVVSASWELGFNKYYIALGSDDLKEAELITDENQIKEFSQYLITQGGVGKTEDGVKVSRLVIGDVYPLGIGFTAKPAADVKGVIHYNDDDEEEQNSLASYPKTEKIEINKTFLNPFLQKEYKKISQNNKKGVILQDNTKFNIMESQELIQEFKSALAEHKFDKEAVASMTETFTQAIKQKDEEYLSSVEAAKNAEAELLKQQEELKASVEKLQTELKQAQSAVESLEAEKTQELIKATFNERMGALDSEYNLEDEDKKIVASELNELDVSAESFADYKAKFEKVWQHKNKAFIEEQEKAFQEKLNEAVEAKLKEVQTSEASEVESTEEVTPEEVLDNAEASNVEISNSSETLSEEPETLAERFQKAFKDNVVVKY